MSLSFLCVSVNNFYLSYHYFKMCLFLKSKAFEAAFWLCFTEHIPYFAAVIEAWANNSIINGKKCLPVLLFHGKCCPIVTPLVQSVCFHMSQLVTNLKYIYHHFWLIFCAHVHISALNAHWDHVITYPSILSALNDFMTHFYRHPFVCGTPLIMKYVPQVVCLSIRVHSNVYILKILNHLHYINFH